jgi:hypothetical protein
MDLERYDDDVTQDREEHVATVLAAVHVLVSALAGLSEQLRREMPGSLSPRAGAALEGLRTENHQLKEALEGRAVIERAKGMLMARHGCDEADAFRMLVDQSRRERRKVRAVAADLIQEIPRQAPSATSVVARLHARPGRP